MSPTNQNYHSIYVTYRLFIDIGRPACPLLMSDGYTSEVVDITLDFSDTFATRKLQAVVFTVSFIVYEQEVFIIMCSVNSGEKEGNLRILQHLRAYLTPTWRVVHRRTSKNFEKCQEAIFSNFPKQF